MDAARVEAFRRAVRDVVTPGDVVVDLASGTGILGLLACEAGAARVYSIEVTAMTEIARSVASANGFGDRITFVRELSTLAQLPERADVVVTDQIGHFGFEAGLWEYLIDATDRFLKPGGHIIPAAIEMIAAPVESPDLFARVEFWTGRPAGLDFSAARDWAVNSGYPATLPAGALLSTPGSIVQLETMALTREPFSASIHCVIARAGTMHGIGGWFGAQLSPTVRLTNAPDAADRINRRNVFLPIDRPVRVRPGDAVDVTLFINPVERMLSWRATITRSGEPPLSFTQSTLRGMLIGREDLQRARADFRPSLTDRGVARRTVLDLCDGRRPLAEIERAVFERHPSLFRTEADASVFVSEVVSRYTR